MIKKPEGCTPERKASDILVFEGHSFYDSLETPYSDPIESIAISHRGMSG